MNNLTLLLIFRNPATTCYTVVHEMKTYELCFRFSEFLHQQYIFWGLH